MIWLSLVGIFLVVARYIYLSRLPVAKNLMDLKDVPPDTISIEEARAMVDDFVGREDRLIVTPVPQTSLLLEQTGPITREFFKQFGSVRTRDSGFSVAASEIAWSLYVDGFLSIGHSEDWDIVQRPFKDAVYIVDGSETALEKMIRFSSIYHAIVDEVQTKKTNG